MPSPGVATKSIYIQMDTTTSHITTGLIMHTTSPFMCLFLHTHPDKETQLVASPHSPKNQKSKKSALKSPKIYFLNPELVCDIVYGMVLELVYEIVDAIRP